MSRFRKEYRALSEEEQVHISAIKSHAEALEEVIEKVLEPRYRALAMTALEESVMWAVKGITAK